jgi:amidase
MTDSYARLDATAQAELVRSGEVEPSALVEAALERIERLNPELNAVIHRLDDKAREAAASPDLPDGPFRGVPFLVKDAVCQTAGDPYHAGSRFLKEAGWRATQDSELARRYRAAGLVICGRTNTPEFAMSATCEPLAYGASRNPWSLDHSTGGSSGGSAAAVAAGLVPAAHGNDMGGSIRIPSSFCGLVGLKPSRARNSLAPHHGEYWGPLTHEHVLTRTVRDSAAILDATAGPAPGDPYTAPPPTRPYREEIGAAPGRLRIGIMTEARAGIEVDPLCRDAVARTARTLEGLGHDIDEVSLASFDDPRFTTGFARIIPAALALDRAIWGERIGRPAREDEIEPLNWQLAEAGAQLSAMDYIQAVEDVHAYSRELMPWWHSGWDILITPTCPSPPPLLGELAPDADPATLMGDLAKLTYFTAPFDATGQPAISLPVDPGQGGLPIGVQLVADSGREDVLFRLASQLEAAEPWTQRWPAMAGL